ncbi:MAG TPA: substrate-binding domain-containing protein [Casimicrobiaceae bacterium]|nr:substrate-binding domain-containing protein [Casimicrobiaceae bacterium]
MEPVHPILALLAHGQAHGYELRSRAERDLRPFWRIDFGQLYRVLHRALRDGLIAAAGRERSTQGPARTLYRLTPRGRAAVAAWLADPAQDDDELTVKLTLAAQGGRLASVVAANRGRLVSRLQEAQRAYRAAIDSGDRGRILACDALRRRCEAAEATLGLAESASASSSSRIRTRTRTCTGDTPPGRRAAETARRDAGQSMLRIAGSDDPLLSWLAHESGFATRVVGSYGGLWALQRREADAASLHLFDAEANEYNAPFLRHLLPESDWVLVNLAWRENGLIVARGNPRDVKGVGDLMRDDLRFLNRQRDAGTRMLLTRALRDAAIDPPSIPGWERAVATHNAVAQAIVLGRADVGPGLRAVAAAWDLDFVPLAQERYDIALPREVLDSASCRRLFGVLRGRTLRRQAGRFAGYDLRDCGRIVGAARPDLMRG